MIPDECPAGGEHEWEEGESYPYNRAGATRRLIACVQCGETHDIGQGSGVL